MKITIASFKGVDSLFFIFMILISPASDSFFMLSYTAITSFREPVTNPRIMSVTEKRTRSRGVISDESMKDLPIFIRILRITINFSATIHSRNLVLYLANLISSASSLRMYFSDL